MLLLVKHTGIKFMSSKMSLVGGGGAASLHIQRCWHEVSLKLSGGQNDGTLRPLPAAARLAERLTSISLIFFFIAFILYLPSETAEQNQLRDTAKRADTHAD